MAIGLQEHSGLFAKALIAVFSDDQTPLQGLSSFFPTVTTKAKGVMIQVKRNRQLVAVDVQRCTDPHRNTFSIAQQKIFIPPFYHELVDFTSCQAYDMTYGTGLVPNAEQTGILMTDVSGQIVALKNMILRAIEKQRASVLQTGVVTMKNGDSIDYHRQASSMVVKTGTAKWDQPLTANYLGDLDAGAIFLRQQGLSIGNEINVVGGAQAMAYLLASDAVYKERQIFSNFRRADIGMPQLNLTTGLTYQGRIGTGEFIYNLWIYSDFYENADGSKYNYIDTNKVVLIPNDFEGKTAFGGLPAVVDYEGNRSIQPVEADFLVYDTVDPVKVTWDWNVKSAPLAVPVSIDRLFTYQVF